MNNEEITKIEKSLIGVSDYNIERWILYLTLLNTNLQEVFPSLGLVEEMFVSKIGKNVFRTILEFTSNQKTLDFEILSDALVKYHTDEELNTFFVFDRLNRPNESLYNDYILVFKRLFKRNEFLDYTLKAQEAVKKRDDETLDGIKSKLQDFSFDIEDDNPEIGTVSQEYLADQWEQLLEGDEEAVKKGQPIYTGYKSFDEKIGGFERGNMVVLGARPSIGKSMTMLNLMESMHSEWYKVMYFSQEMYTRYILSRILARNLKIDLKKFKNPEKLEEKEKKKIREFIEEFKADKTRHLYYNPDMTSADILAAAKEVKKKYGLDAIFIDYLGKIKPNSRNFNRSTNEIITEVSEQIFRLGSALDVVVITASQLSRWSQKNTAEGSLYIPKMEDLRDSGSIEQDADIIFGLSMDRNAQKGWFKGQPPLDYHLTCLKNRNGPMADITLQYFPIYNKLEDWFSAIEEKTTETTPSPAFINTNNAEILNMDMDSDAADFLSLFDKENKLTPEDEVEEAEIVEDEQV